LGDSQRIAYGKTLLDIVAHSMSPVHLLETATAMNETKKQLTERVNFIVKKPRNLIIAAISLLLIAAIALYIVAQKGHMGEKGKKYAAVVTDYLKSKMPKPKARTAPVPMPQAPAETRKEFVAKLNELMEFYRLNPSANSAKFLQDSDKFLLSSLMPPVTAKEKEVYQEFRGVYALADEELRAEPARQKQIARIEEFYNSKIREVRKKRLRRNASGSLPLSRKRSEKLNRRKSVWKISRSQNAPTNSKPKSGNTLRIWVPLS
jgi:phage host-nuclease inhibitor protein Gam